MIRFESARPLQLCAAVAQAVFCIGSALPSMPVLAQSQRSFDVPAGDLSASLDAYSRQAGVQIVYRMDDVRGLQAPAVKGTLSREAALDAVLSGSGLQSRRDGADAVVVFRAAPSAAAADSSSGLQTLIVTAQRRPEPSQTVPVSLTALSSQQLEAHQVQSLKDVSRLSSNLLVSTFSRNSPTLAIRGISNTFQRIGVNKPVAVVLDDVFIPRNSAADFELFDLESVAVLRGPQGTLFGRNVTGGAIMLNTRRPSFEGPEWQGQIGLGSFDEVQMQGMVNVPLTENLAASGTISIRERAGTGRDRLTGAELDSIDSRSVRGQLRWKLGRGAEVLFAGDYGEDRNTGRTLSSTTLGDDGDRRTSEVGVPQGFERTVSGASVRVNWMLPWAELTSISALRRSSSSETFSGVGTNFSFLTGGAQSVTQDADKVSTTTQEFRLASPKAAWGDVVSGVYLLHEDGRRTLGLRSLAARTGLQTASTVGLEHVRTDSHAVFADGKFNLTPGLTLGAGVRYTVDEKTAQLTRSNLITPAASFTTPELSTRWSRWTPRLGLNWQASPSVMAYGTLTRGFTSGGYNTEATSLAAFVQPFSPETVTNQEVGLKSQWLNNRVRVNFAAFRMKYRDKQELLLNSTTGILTITNASQATVPGFEAEVAWRVLPGINITANYGQLRGRYDSFVLGNINFTGNPLASSPRHSGSVAMDWRVPISADGVLVGAISHARTGTFNTGAANDPNLQIPGYGLTNASLGYEPRSGQWRVRVWVRNASDTAYVLTRSTQVVRAEYLGEPRTFGVTLSANN